MYLSVCDKTSETGRLNQTSYLKFKNYFLCVAGACKPHTHEIPARVLAREGFRPRSTENSPTAKLRPFDPLKMLHCLLSSLSRSH